MPLPIFATGQPLTAVDANTLARQGVITVETVIDREKLPAPHEGMIVYVEADMAYYGRVNGAWKVLIQEPRPYTADLGNMSLGNGTLDAGWSQVGDIVHWWFRIVLGTTSSITGLVWVTMPWRPARATATPAGSVVVGNLLVRDVSASGAGSRRAYTLISDYTVAPHRAWGMNPSDGLGPSAGSPWTWEAGDSLDGSGSYRVEN